MVSEAETLENCETPCVSGLWRRIGAALVDGLILGTVGMILGVAFFSQLVELGEWGRIIGLAIAVPYFALLNSRIGKGQTIGKKLLGIRVVNAHAGNIGLGGATLRAVILLLPCALNGILIPSGSSIGFQSLLSLGLFGIGGSIVYLAVANRRSRQSLHDLAVDSWVVRADSESLPPKLLPRIHAIVVVALLVGSLSVPALVSDWAEEEPLLEGIFPMQAAIRESMGTQRVGVLRGSSTFTSSSGSKTTQYLSVTVRFPRELDDFEPIAREVASIVLEMDDRIETYDQIRIRLEYGFNILIAKTSIHRTFSYTPEEWRNEIPKSI
jgi:uncharacterized RDD family membrane protein YckC